MGMVWALLPVYIFLTFVSASRIGKWLKHRNELDMRWRRAMEELRKNGQGIPTGTWR